MKRCPHQAAAIAAEWKIAGALLSVLHEVQAVTGNALSQAVAEVISREMRPALISKFIMLATFYSFFST